MIILPSIYRPDNVRRFFHYYKETGATLPVWLVLDSDNSWFYGDIELPKLCRKVRVSPGTKIGDIFNIIFKYHPNEDYYAILADDVVPTTFRWDIILKEAAGRDRIAWGYDGGCDETLPRHPFIGGDLVRKLGFIAVPGVKHWFVDNGWKDLSQALNCGEYRPEVRMTHMHYTIGKSPRDRTYDEQPDPRTDEMTYRMWRERNFPEIIARIKGETPIDPVVAV